MYPHFRGLFRTQMKVPCLQKGLQFTDTWPSIVMYTTILYGDRMFTGRE